MDRLYQVSERLTVGRFALAPALTRHGLPRVKMPGDGHDGLRRTARTSVFPPPGITPRRLSFYLAAATTGVAQKLATRVIRVTAAAPATG